METKLKRVAAAGGIAAGTLFIGYTAINIYSAASKVETNLKQNTEYQELLKRETKLTNELRIVTDAKDNIARREDIGIDSKLLEGFFATAAVVILSSKLRKDRR